MNKFNFNSTIDNVLNEIESTFSNSYQSVEGWETEVEFLPIEDFKLHEKDEIDVSVLSNFFDTEFQISTIPPIIIDNENYIVDGRKRFILALSQGIPKLPIRRQTIKRKKLF
jgi:hypothetical protein